MEPKESERVCPISFEVARILLGGGPDSRPSFWKVYREELALNKRTGYENQHLAICRPMLLPLKDVAGIPHYFRKGKLVPEREVLGAKVGQVPPPLH
jgi:hypothetical protein